jgi:hypothetical protein
VYVAAFAPDANQSIGEISKSFPKPPGLDALRPLPDGYLNDGGEARCRLTL